MAEEKQFVGILVTFDDKGEATINMAGVSAQQMLVAAGLLDEMSRHMLRTAFTNSARKQAEEQMQKMQDSELMARVQKEIKRGKSTR